VVSAAANFGPPMCFTDVSESLESVVLLELVILTPKAGGLMKSCSSCGCSILRIVSVEL
jgi:hypothetical protein